jgi:hypothetical protein
MGRKDAQQRRRVKQTMRNRPSRLRHELDLADVDRIPAIDDRA